jgi:hypothetical protein
VREREVKEREKGRKREREKVGERERHLHCGLVARAMVQLFFQPWDYTEFGRGGVGHLHINMCVCI